jgi:hypothetical protein
MAPTIRVERVKLVEQLEKVLAARQADAQAEADELNTDLERAIEELDFGDKHRLLEWIRRGGEQAGSELHLSRERVRAQPAEDRRPLELGERRRWRRRVSFGENTALENLIAFYKLDVDALVELALDSDAAKYLRLDTA